MISLAEKKEALDHLHATYSYVLYCEPRTVWNKRRLAAISTKFRQYKDLPVLGGNRRAKGQGKIHYALKLVKSHTPEEARARVSALFNLDKQATAKLVNEALRRVKKAA